MYYYKVKDNLVYKYEVILDDESLDKVRKEIIDKCSVIEHVKMRTKWISFNDKDEFRNFKSTPLPNRFPQFEQNVEFREYEIEYDFYNFPNIIHLIRLLRQGHTNSIQKIENYTDDITDRINKIKAKRREEEHSSIDELNKNQISVNPYCKKLLDCITLNEVAVLPLEEVEKIANFLFHSESKTVQSDLCKKLSLKKDEIY